MFVGVLDEAQQVNMNLWTFDLEIEQVVKGNRISILLKTDINVAVRRARKNHLQQCHMAFPARVFGATGHIALEPLLSWFASSDSRETSYGLFCDL